MHRAVVGTDIGSRRRHGLLRSAELQELAPGDEPVEVGPFRLEFVRMAHSIPDNVAVLLESAAGRVLWGATDDWTAHAWDADTGKLLRQFTLGPAPGALPRS